MKFIITIFLSLSLVSISLAQGVQDKIVTEMCDCISNESDGSSFELAIGLCMLSSTKGKEEAIKKEMGIDISNMQNFESLGERLGIALTLKCPKFMELVSKEMENDDSVFKEMVEESIDSKLEDRKNTRREKKTLTGKIVGIDHDQFSSIKLQAENGRKVTFYWLGYFEGSDNISKLNRKKVQIDYVEMEVYSNEISDYKTIRVIQKVSEN